MRSKEILLWQDEQEYAALQDVLERKGTNVEAEMTRALVALYQREVPETVRNSIWEEIQTEELEAAQRAEAARRFAAFHITEGGQEYWVRQERPLEFMDAAIALRRYLKDGPEQRTPSLAASLRGAESVSKKQYSTLVLERLEDTGRVTGIFDIHLDRGKFSTLRGSGRWESYSVEDISVAAYRAMRKERSTQERRWGLFSERLLGRELPEVSIPIEVEGTRRLRPEEITFLEDIVESESCLNFYLPCWFPVDKVFGTHVGTDVNDDYLNVYANYDMAEGKVRECLDLTLCRGDGVDIPLVYRMDEGEQAAVLKKMRDHCQEQSGQSLEDYAASLQMEDPGPQMTM